MKRIPFLFLCFLFFNPCTGQKSKSQIAADYVRNYSIQNIKDLTKIITIFVLIEPITPSEVAVMQCAEYSFAGLEAKKAHNQGYLNLNEIAYQWMLNAKQADNKTFLCYRAKTLTAYMNKGFQNMVAEKWLYFDRKMQPYSKWKLIKKVAKADNEALKLTPLVIDSYMRDDLRRQGFISYEY